MKEKISLPLLFRILSTINICIATVVTPLLVRSLIDGIIPTKDMKAIAITLIILGVSEVLNILLQFYMNLHLDAVESFELSKKKEELIELIYNSYKFQIDQNKFLDFWNSDLQRSVYLKFKNPWYRLKDGLMILLLALICLNISYLAGFVVIFIFALNLGMVYFSQKAQSRLFTKTVSARDQERSLLLHTMTHIEEMKDHNQWSDIGLNLLQQLKELTELKTHQSHQRSKDQRQNGFIKLSLIFGILAVGGILFAQDKFSMGNLWALMITIYRINGPIQNYCRWILNVKSEGLLQIRVSDMWKQIAQNEFNKPDYFNRLSKILDDVVNKKKRACVQLEDDSLIPLVKEAIRFWKSRSGKKDEIYILEDSDKGNYESKIVIRFCHQPLNPSDQLVLALNFKSEYHFDNYFHLSAKNGKIEFT